MNNPIGPIQNDPVNQSPTDKPIHSPVIESNEGENADAKVETKYRFAIIASVIFHILLVLAMVSWYLPKLYQPAQNGAANAGNDAGPSSGTPQQATPDSTASVPDELIETSVQMQIDKAETLSDEEKLTQLETKLKHLESIASEKSVSQITEKVGSSLGLDSQQYQPKQAAETGVFDANTAQMTDVTRVKTPKGQWVYRTVMVDAQGRTLDVPISAEDGESLYQTFQQIKKFPMAAGIYRSVVMPMMQKIISTQDAAADAAKKAERMQQQSEAPDYDKPN